MSKVSNLLGLIFKVVTVFLALIVVAVLIDLPTYSFGILKLFLMFALIITLVHHFSKEKKRNLLLVCGIIALPGIVYLITPMGIGLAVTYIGFALIIAGLLAFLQFLLTKIGSRYIITILLIIAELAGGYILVRSLTERAHSYKQGQVVTSEQRIQGFDNVLKSNRSARDKAFDLFALAKPMEEACDQITDWPSRLTCYNYGQIYINAMQKVGELNNVPNHNASLAAEICRTSFADYYYVGGRWIKDKDRAYLKFIGAEWNSSNNPLPSWPKCQ